MVTLLNWMTGKRATLLRCIVGRAWSALLLACSLIRHTEQGSKDTTSLEKDFQVMKYILQPQMVSWGKNNMLDNNINKSSSHKQLCK